MGVSRVDYEGRTLVDLTGDTVTAAVLLEGHTAHGADGEQITGTFPRVWYTGGTVCAFPQLASIDGDTMRVAGEYAPNTKTLWIGEVK